MKRTSLLIWAFGLTMAYALPAQAAEEKVVSGDQMMYTEAVPGASRTVISGDPATMAFSGFVKFAPGIKHGLHSHSSDSKLVIISGQFMYAKEGGAEMMYGPGSYLYIPAGLVHNSGSGPAGCHFYEEWSGKFDMIPKAPAMPAKKKKS